MNEGREDEVVRGRAEDRVAGEAARNESEQFRRLAEEAREVRDQHREALETIRQNESGCERTRRSRASPARGRGWPPRRHAPLAKTPESPPTPHGKWSLMRCARPPPRCKRRSIKCKLWRKC